MRTTASQRLLTLSLPEFASVVERGEAVHLHVKRGSLVVVLTVPTTTREWFVEASDTSTGTRAEDWCDYDGYDSSSPERLDQAMAKDVSSFVQRLLSSELKLDTGNRNRLLWKLAGTWEQAVPLDASAV